MSLPIGAGLGAVAIALVAVQLYALVPDSRVPGAGRLVQRRPLNAPTDQKLKAVQDTAFFQHRNRIDVRPPRAMELDELIAMYQLERSRWQFEAILKRRSTVTKDEVFSGIFLTPVSQP